MRRAIWLVGFLLASCASFQPHEPDLFALQIQIGRLGVILDQEVAARDVLAGTSSKSGAENENDLAPQYLSLYVTVLRHNALRAEVCAAGLVAASQCRGQFLPDWLVAPTDAHPTSVLLQRWTDEAQDAILPFWSALCARASAKSGDEYQCAIE